MVIETRLAWQKGDFAKYAEVALEVSVLEATGLQVTYRRELTAAHRLAIEFGAAMFIERYSAVLPHCRQCKIDVVSVRTAEPDTTLQSIAYVVFQALCKFFQVGSGDSFYFCTESGCFSTR
ncbi:hypothetical protein [Anatilimnocola floriformis]|uniref:hypothetical protein n=1 Tax=Anatilimnocola floriformis TaxID=2948575 RepID=UPI0020C54CF6|nr:hypothetical protein [Anatilimnocola floriformis]